MSREPLIHVPNGIYSVVSKCNNDEFHFDADEKFKMYLEHLYECKQKLGFELYDITCMSNHMHEIYRVAECVTIAEILHQVKGHFSYKFNMRFGRRDHFWRNKPFYRIIQDECYAFHVMHYNQWNPVTAGLVNHPAEWPYSGYRFHMLGERRGIMGKLLSTIPGIDVEKELINANPRMAADIHRILSDKKIRFICKS